MKVTEGFSPHFKISTQRALKLGIESENEEAIFSLRDFISLKDFQEKFQAELPEGVQIKAARFI